MMTKILMNIALMATMNIKLRIDPWRSVIELALDEFIPVFRGRVIAEGENDSV